MRSSWTIILVASLAGCNPVERIANRANDIRNEAQSLQDHGKQTGDEVVVKRSGKIIGYASDIHSEIPNVENKTPEWLTMLQWWGVALAAVAVAFILWQSGVGQAIRIAVGWIPKRKANAAELAVDMLDPSSPEGDREYVAAMRAQDPEFDAAFRRAQARKKKGTP